MKDIKIKIETALKNYINDVNIKVILIKDDNTLFSLTNNDIKMKGYACYGADYILKDYLTALIPLLIPLEETYEYYKFGDTYVINDDEIFIFMYEDIEEENTSLLYHPALNDKLEEFQNKLANINNATILDLDIRTTHKNVKHFFKYKKLVLTYLHGYSKVTLKNDKIFFPDIFSFINVPEQWKYNETMLLNLRNVTSEENMLNVIQSLSEEYKDYDLIENFKTFLKYYEKIDKKLTDFKLFTEYYEK